MLVPSVAAEDDLAISIDGMNARRIMRLAHALGKETWLWTVTGPALLQAGITSSGETETLEESRQAFGTTFDTWLQWALASSGPVMWHIGVSP